MELSGLQFRYDGAAPSFAKIDTTSLRIGGRRWQPQRRYSVTVNSGSADMLDALGISVTNVEHLPAFEYEVLLDYVASKRVLRTTGQPRIWDVSAQ